MSVGENSSQNPDGEMEWKTQMQKRCISYFFVVVEEKEVCCHFIFHVSMFLKMKHKMYYILITYYIVCIFHYKHYQEIWKIKKSRGQKINLLSVFPVLRIITIDILIYFLLVFFLCLTIQVDCFTQLQLCYACSFISVFHSLSCEKWHSRVVKSKNSKTGCLGSNSKIFHLLAV